jgi:hypothetical protein
MKTASHAFTRLQRGIRRAARTSEPYEKLLKFLLLLGGLLYGTVFLVRTWALPSASLSIRATERVPSGPGAERLIVTASFTVGDAANLRVRDLESTCTVLDNERPCGADCRTPRNSLRDGELPRKESVSWACEYRVPAGACVEITQKIIGRASGLAGAGSHWWTTLITCKPTGASATAK